MTDHTYDGVETDWLANSTYGYGFGYTREQALHGMLASIRSVDTDTRVHLVEHVGTATVGMTGWEVEEFVSGEVVEIEQEVLEAARQKAAAASTEVEMALDTAEVIEDLGDE